MLALSLRQFLFDACSALGIGEYGSVGPFLLRRTIIVFCDTASPDHFRNWHKADVLKASPDVRFRW
jgi:hypothetical protein